MSPLVAKFAALILPSIFDKNNKTLFYVNGQISLFVKYFYDVFTEMLFSIIWNIKI